MDDWVAKCSQEIARRAPRELEALVAVSSPSGDRHGAEECAAVCAALPPDDATLERVPCSSPDHADDLIARLRGSGTRRLLLLGHLDTVVAHDAHRAARARRRQARRLGHGRHEGRRRALARRAARAGRAAARTTPRSALLLVCDEEWRTAPFGHVERFAGFDACLCFEGGERTPDGEEGVVVRRKAAGTLRVRAQGRAAHSGSAPDRGRNALLALAAAAQAVAGCHDPSGADHLTAVPTVLHSGDAFNVVPGDGELVSDMRADSSDAFDARGRRDPRRGRRRDAAPRDDPPVAGDGQHARRPCRCSSARPRRSAEPVAAMRRGGASDASHFAAAIPLTVDGLGPRGGAAHNPDEYIVAASLAPRAAVALALAQAALSR